MTIADHSEKLARVIASTGSITILAITFAFVGFAGVHIAPASSAPQSILRSGPGQITYAGDGDNANSVQRVDQELQDAIGATRPKTTPDTATSDTEFN